MRHWLDLPLHRHTVVIDLDNEKMAPDKKTTKYLAQEFYQIQIEKGTKTSFVKIL